MVSRKVKIILQTDGNWLFPIRGRDVSEQRGQFNSMQPTTNIYLYRQESFALLSVIYYLNSL